MTRAFDDDSQKHLGIEKGGPPGYDDGEFYRKWLFGYEQSIGYKTITFTSASAALPGSRLWTTRSRFRFSISLRNQSRSHLESASLKECSCGLIAPNLTKLTRSRIPPAEVSDPPADFFNFQKKGGAS